MQQILSVWNALDMRRRTIVVLATLAVFAAVLSLSRMASQPSMSLLYAGLDSGPAGEVVKALEASGALHEVRGGAIYVETARRDELRMTLAADGLPANSTYGYELLDGLTGFGTTSQMFDAAYWRAKEGELARTIMSNPQIQSARVHIANPNPQGLRARGALSASVSVTTADGSLSATHAKALKYLIASAVSGLLPNEVSVVDSRGGLILAGDEAEAAGTDATSRADELRRNVERLLEARVGYGNAVVEVSVDTFSERESILERRIDPDSRIAISSETQETTNAATDNRNSSVTVASNLPNGDAGGSNGQSSSNNSETRERVNYEISETTREVLRTPGAVKRISVAVLVDGVRSINANGAEIWEPRSEDELAALHDLVASAVGFDETRGDTITLKSLEFEPVAEAGSTAPTGFFDGLSLDIMSIIQLAVLTVVSLVLGLFVLRPILTAPRNQSSGELPAPDTLSTPQNPVQQQSDTSDLPALTGEIDDGDLSFPQMAVVSDYDLGDDDNGSRGINSDDPVERLRALIEERQDETVEILRGWMEEEGAGT